MSSWESTLRRRPRSPQHSVVLQGISGRPQPFVLLSQFLFRLLFRASVFLFFPPQRWLAVTRIRWPSAPLVHICSMRLSLACSWHSAFLRPAGSCRFPLLHFWASQSPPPCKLHIGRRPLAHFQPPAHTCTGLGLVVALRVSSGPVWCRGSLCRLSCCLDIWTSSVRLIRIVRKGCQ